MSPKKKERSLKNDFISRLPENKQHLLALVVILVLPFILFDAATIGGQRFMGHDTIQWRAGAESVIDYRETHDGEEPLWSTHMFSGMPAYVISVERAVPHIDVLFRRLTGSIYPASFFWILMGGVYLFFILQGIHPLSSLLGSICISFTTYIPIILGAGHNSKFIAFVFIPWMFVGYWLLTRSDKKLLSFAAFAIAVTLEFRAGHPQVTYYFFYLLGLWWLYDTWQAWRQQRLKPWLNITGLLLLAGILAFLGTAQRYWQLLEYAPYSIRGGSALAEGSGSGGLNMEYAFSWSQGWGELLTLIIPGLFGGSSGEAYWGPKPGTSGPHYLGTVAFILFLVGMFRSRHTFKYLFFGVGTLTLLFSLGYHFEAFNRLFFNYVPWFNKFRTPEMWLIVTVFCYSVVAIYGLGRLIEMAKEKSKDLKPLVLPLGIVLGLGLLFTLGSDALFSFEKPGQRRQIAQQVASQNNVSPSNPQVQQAVSNFINTRLKPARKKIAHEDSVRYLIIALIVSGLIVAFYRQQLSPGFFLAGLVIVAGYDYISIDNRYTNEEAMVPQDVSIEQVIERQKRPLDEFIQEHIASGQGWSYRVLPLGDNPFNNAVPAYFYPTVGGYSGAKLSIYQDLIDRLLFTGQRRLNMEVLNMLNVKYISSNGPFSLSFLEQVYTGEDGYVYENNQVLPKAFFVDSVAYASTPEEAVAMLTPEADFDASKMAVVENAEPLQVQRDTTATVTVTHYEERTIEFEIQRSTPGFLVLSEIYYPPGWELTIDGEPAEIYKTNYVLRGIHVSAGEHTFTMQFNPRSYIWGSRIAWAANLIQWSILLAGLALWYRREKNIEPQNKE